MPHFLVFHLSGTLASWGDIAVGEQRPTLPFPTKSAILGLIAAAKGIDRVDETAHLELQNQVGFAVEVVEDGGYLSDYHTTQVPPQTALKNKRIESRKHEIEAGDLGTILSTRAYRISPSYTIALQGKKEELDAMQLSLRCPVYTPYLGRKSCPLDRPMNPQVIQAESFQDAIKTYEKGKESLGHCFWEDAVSSSEKPLYHVSLYAGVRSRKRWAFSEIVMHSSVKWEGK